DEEHRDVAPALVGVDQRSFEVPHEAVPVEQSGQRVVAGLEVEVLLELAALGDVERDADGAVKPDLLVVDALEDQLDRHGRSVLATQLDVPLPASTRL